MNCAEVEEWMSAYVINDLQDDFRSEIEFHIQTCPSCQAWYLEVVEMAEIWSDEGARVDGLDLVESVQSQIQFHQPLQSSQSSQPSTSQSDGSDWDAESSALDNQSFQLLEGRKQQRNLRLSRVYVHYGVAASFTIALFQLGVFQHLGLRLVHNGILLSQQVQSFSHLFSAF